MTATAAQLHHLPLFSGLTLEQLEKLRAALSPRKVKKGEFLFHAGDAPKSFAVLTEGEIELVEANEPTVFVRPLAPLGELGAVTGLARNTTAKATRESKLLEISADELCAMLAKSSELAAAFHRGLLGVVCDKVGRDKVRMDDMRANIIRTQKAMKQLREVVLAAEETPISQPLCDQLDQLIENNRRGHYRVAPVAQHPADVRLADGRRVALLELSEGYLKLDATARLEKDSELSMVLCLPGREIAVSGKVERSGKDGSLLRLDQLIDEYRGALLGYLTQLQLLDVVV